MIPATFRGTCPIIPNIRSTVPFVSDFLMKSDPADVYTYTVQSSTSVPYPGSESKN